MERSELNRMAGVANLTPPVVYRLEASSPTIYNFETFLNSFQNLRSISQNALWLKNDNF